jgi:predicted RNA binding protein YcfA (HicA-like mRNA interferase family)
MSKVPRNISGRDLAKLLKKYNYQIVRETGSHLRLISKRQGTEHKITIPDHSPVKIGTLNSILDNVADYLQMTKGEVVAELFPE